jgi:ATP-dependent exoDNAse (exonuclease V) alpha subunit
MAIFRLETKILGREKTGRSVVAAAAYRAGTKLKDELRDKVYDYTRRLKGVLDTKVLAPAGAPEWALNPEQLWNTVEKGEKRKDAQLAREFILALPKELTADAQFRLATEWAEKELVRCGMVVEVSLHHDKRDKNPHAHLLCTMRKLDADRFSSKKATEWNDKGLLLKQRESWADSVNKALEEAGRPERVDHRSLKDRGIDREPEPKIGVAATAMKRRGVEVDPIRVQLVRWVKSLNEVRPMVKALRAKGEIAQKGVGGTWWEKSVTFMGRARQKAKELVKGAWRKLVEPARSRGKDDDLSR